MNTFIRNATLVALTSPSVAQTALARTQTCRPLPERCPQLPVTVLPYPDIESARENGVRIDELPATSCHAARDLAHDQQILLGGRYFLCRASRY